MREVAAVRRVRVSRWRAEGLRHLRVFRALGMRYTMFTLRTIMARQVGRRCRALSKDARRGAAGRRRAAFGRVALGSPARAMRYPARPAALRFLPAHHTTG